MAQLERHRFRPGGLEDRAEPIGQGLLELRDPLVGEAALYDRKHLILLRAEQILQSQIPGPSGPTSTANCTSDAVFAVVYTAVRPRQMSSAHRSTSCGRSNRRSVS
jgi:hypothetical protein